MAHNSEGRSDLPSWRDQRDGHLYPHNEPAAHVRPQPYRMHNSDAARGGRSFRSDHRESPPLSPMLTPIKQPARSYFHSSHHVLNPASHTETTSHHPSWVIRDQTAELASIALTDAAHSFQSKFSPLALTPSHKSTGDMQPLFLPGPVSDIKAIREESEPASPEGYPQSSRTSYLTHLLKSSPPNERIGPAETNDGTPGPSERDSLLPKRRASSSRRDYNAIHGEDIEDDIEAQGRSHSVIPKISVAQVLIWPKAKVGAVFKNESWNSRMVWEKAVKEPVGYIPAVALGLLLNLLDGLSYGMILFPLGQSLFSNLQADGLSIFYMSCIISQLVYSCGGSVFKGGIGSEMIEVVPFFHKMAFTILAKVGEDDPKAVLATTILAFSASSVLTGLVFFALGALKLGSLTGFFPRHILLGCIGGVGWFLIATGVEVSARLDGNLNYDLPTLQHLVRPDTLALWSVPLTLAVLLTLSKKYIKHQLLDAMFFMSVMAIFYLVVAIVPSLNFPMLRDLGWVFEQQSGGQPWWHFYTLYDFKATNWEALASTIPAMFALTFFGVLHVPINVPALGVSTGVDDLNVDRELIAHGISNALSGFAGSIQNYLVYTNSILFIRSGGDSRVAGVMLAFATAGLMMVGPGIIGYIPVMVVGALIFYLGMELLREALYDTWRKVHRLEYLTILIIVVTMGAWDFVIGILIGIVLACVSYVVQTSRVSAIRSMYTGAVARSTVRRHPIQQRFLKEVGCQIYICSLTGYMFFGTIGSVERSVRELLEDHNFQNRPIRYFIFDLSHVTGIDFSAAEAFTKMRRLVAARKVEMVVCGVTDNGEVGKSLQSVGVWSDEGVQVYENLNAALESCENELLVAFYRQRDNMTQRHSRNHSLLEVPENNFNNLGSIHDVTSSSPRRSHVLKAAASALKENFIPQNRWQNFKQPLPLILQTFQEMTDKNEDFWFKACLFFQRKELAAGEPVFKRGALADGFYILEEGILRADYDLEQGKFSESIVPGTTCGELPFFSETPRTATVTAEKDSVAWVLDEENWKRLQEKHPEVAYELLRICLKLTSERLIAITSYILTNAG